MKNFKELEVQQMAFFSPHKEKVIFERVSGTMDVFRFLGAILEMYVPVMANTVVSLTGVSSSETESASGASVDLGARSDQSEPRGPSEGGAETIR